ncbi:MAG: ABC transporter ATP-binding protein, partial [Chloroflexi bacterium]|nr:ABC transporter ATP-binding protein [Chloroflexota bacterium]
EVRKRVGYLPEPVPLYTDLTVVAYLEFFAELRRVPEREDWVDEVLETVTLLERADSLIGNLSKGLRQRVGLAQALLHQPEVLILDEPTIGLDPAQVVEVRQLIRRLGKERTVMLSTHVLYEAQEVCNRVMIINKGRIVAEDTPERLQARLAGGARVRLRVSGDGADLARLVEAVPGVTAVHPVEDGLLEFETAPGQDARPEVARLVVNNGYNLLEFRPTGASLEDIFLQLTREQKLAEEGATEASDA